MEIVHYRIGGLKSACGRGPVGNHGEQLDESATTCPSCIRNVRKWNAARWFQWAMAAEERGTAQPALDALYARALAKAKEERDTAVAFYEEVQRRGKRASHIGASGSERHLSPRLRRAARKSRSGEAR